MNSDESTDRLPHRALSWAKDFSFVHFATAILFSLVATTWNHGTSSKYVFEDPVVEFASGAALVLLYGWPVTIVLTAVFLNRDRITGTFEKSTGVDVTRRRLVAGTAAAVLGLGAANYGYTNHTVHAEPRTIWGEYEPEPRTIVQGTEEEFFIPGGQFDLTVLVDYQLTGEIYTEILDVSRHEDSDAEFGSLSVKHWEQQESEFDEMAAAEGFRFRVGPEDGFVLAMLVDGNTEAMGITMDRPEVLG